MNTTRLGIGGVRLARLAACLAAALALASGGTAATRAPHDKGAPAAWLDRARNADSSEKPSWWIRPDPADIMARWQPIRHAIPALPVNAVVVQNCDDSGTGSLRDVLANANSGDTIDLTQLSCSTITLTTGSIQFAQTSITLQGPGFQYLSISGNNTDAPLLHQGAGALYINDLSVEHGLNDIQSNNARGGCIFSSGSVFLNDSVVAYCTANNATNTGGAEGGAIYGHGVSLSNSSVVNSSAINSQSYGLGGGIYSRGSVAISHSVVAGNYASLEAGGLYAFSGLNVMYSTIDGNHAGRDGGGLVALGNITISNSTISNNQAIASIGGAYVQGYGATAPTLILSSTISGNRAGTVGGAKVTDYDARVSNSTIAFNYEGSATTYGAGLYIRDINVDLESTIIGNNTYAGGASPDDLGGTASATTTGANNLVGYSSVPTPSDTILMQSPLLGPLANNGGPTRTHRILSGSPAVNAGNDVANVASDQRGSDYPRVVGSFADIGAYELNSADVIFVNGFDP